MRISIYDKNLFRIAVIDNCYVSCFWQEVYNDVGRFTLELQETKELKAKIKPDYFVGRSDRSTIMIIKSVEIKDKKIVAAGYEATKILDDIVRTGEPITEIRMIPITVKGIYDNSVAKRNIYAVPQPELSVRTEVTVQNDSLLNLLRTMCQSADLGFRSIKVGDQIHLIFYKPEKKVGLVFSENFGNVKIKSIIQSSELYKNYAVVLGLNYGVTRKRVDVDLSGGEEKNQILVDAGDESFNEEEETEEEYEARLYSRGVEALVGKTKTLNCSISLPPEGFGNLYDLGDIVTVYLNEYGIKLEARVVSFQQKTQKNATETTVEVGNLIFMR